MATVKHWLHAVTGSRTRRDTPTEIYRHEESIEFWSDTMTSPGRTGSLELPAKLIHTEPSRTASANDIRCAHSHQDVILNPDCEQMITAILSVVINSPHKPLPPEYNSSLLHVLESYGSLVTCLRQERRNNEIDALAMENTLQEWEKERKESRAEVKRLEERIAQLQGVEALRKAKEDSTLQSKNYETSDRAIARIRRYRTLGRKVLHQPSITSRSRINLSPPSGGDRKKLRIGRPPASREDTILSAVISPELDAPRNEVRLVESSAGSPAELVLLPNDINKVGSNTLLRTQPSSEASSAATVINLQLRPEPVRTASEGTSLPESSCLGSEEVANTNNASTKVCGSQYKRHSRRQLSFAPGDDFEFRMKGLTTPAERNIQSNPGILIKSIAYSAEQSLLAVSPIHACTKPQEYTERRTSSNYSVTVDDKAEIVGPSAHMGGPGVSAMESLKRVQAAVRTTRREETGSGRGFNSMSAAVFARRVLQSIPAEDNNDSQKALVIEGASTPTDNVCDKGDMGEARTDFKDMSL
ncbi:MAG: hypothetical protein M1839_009177 [Geoglossum umbratile]|nr:MAG: hypothetical protein M1839_009177 [Geoglossum umbratile]